MLLVGSFPACLGALRQMLSQELVSSVAHHPLRFSLLFGACSLCANSHILNSNSGVQWEKEGWEERPGKDRGEGSALAEGSGACTQDLQKRKSEMPWPPRTSTAQGEK